MHACGSLYLLSPNITGPPPPSACGEGTLALRQFFISLCKQFAPLFVVFIFLLPLHMLYFPF
ncbi:hypothetical protein SLEP1_g1965 [Rubroshorea leprosula]|uniref:Uncharacterized protein n=1 Tax=Rubroshorea leprosula TaxID=152421 RepID=A0AAV5HNT8_9ROSI|nr:hypothetical protein SLEP1_g1965 [Rubroshorea leprosula]